MIMSMITSIAGLGLFIYGLRMMGDGLESIAGNKMKRLFEKITTNPVLGVGIGAIVTFIMQSSSVTTVMVVGFVNAGLMNLYQASSVIMGANIGTTITTQFISLSIGKFAPLIIFIGTFLIIYSKNQNSKTIGNIVLGFGILFLGMDFMKEALNPLSDSHIIIKTINFLDGQIVILIFIGMFITFALQSSNAVTALLIVLAGTGFIDISFAIPIIFGVNIGTCITALISSVGASKIARKSALIHLYFNVFGTLIFIPLIPALTWLVTSINPSNLQRQIANAHTIFNLVNTIIMIPFIRLLVMLVNKIIPGEDELDSDNTMYLDNRIMETPMIAIGQAEKEINRMMSIAKSNLKLSMEAVIENESKDIQIIIKNEKIINVLEQEITKYLAGISKVDISDTQKKNIISMISMVSDIERIGDRCKNLVELAEEKTKKSLTFSEEGIKELEDIYKYTLSAVELSMVSYVQNDVSKAKDVFRVEERIDYLESELRQRHIRRLARGACDAYSGAVFLDVISNLERIGDHSMNIAESVLSNN